MQLSNYQFNQANQIKSNQINQINSIKSIDDQTKPPSKFKYQSNLLVV